jgi:hypothetical protein
MDEVVLVSAIRVDIELAKADGRVINDRLRRFQFGVEQIWDEQSVGLGRGLTTGFSHRSMLSSNVGALSAERAGGRTHLDSWNSGISGQPKPR